MAKEQDNKSKKKKMILIGLGAAATGLLGYFGWEYWKRNKRKKEEQEEDNASQQLPPQQGAFMPSFFPKPSANDEFPLKKGSRGPRVKALQEALIARYGKSILPRFGADGIFGGEVIAALKKNNLPESVDESAYNVLVQASSFDAKELAKSLYSDAIRKNISGVGASLKKMKSRDDYSAVSKEFQNYRIGGVRQTLVNGLLNSFTSESHKQQIRLEFTRMGLRYDGSKWSLSGLDGFTIITVEPAVIWRTPQEGAKVPAKMVLGTEIASSEGYTLFENNGKKFIVKTTSIRYL